MKIKQETHVSDCFDRRSFPNKDDARGFASWMFENHDINYLVPFYCRTCQRWHVAGGYKNGATAEAKAKEPTRCTSDRELHLNICRITGLTLDELQVKYDLSKVKLAGPGIEVVQPKNHVP